MLPAKLPGIASYHDVLLLGHLLTEHWIKTGVEKMCRFPGKGQLSTCVSSTRAASLLSFVFLFSSLLKGSCESWFQQSGNNVDGQINKQASRRPCRAAVD